MDEKELKDISLQEQRVLIRILNEVVAIGDEHNLPLWIHVARQMGFNQQDLQDCNSGEALIDLCLRRRMYHKYAKFERILTEVRAQGGPQVAAPGGPGGDPPGPGEDPPGAGGPQADHGSLFQITLVNIPHDVVRNACRK